MLQIEILLNYRPAQMQVIIVVIIAIIIIIIIINDF